MKTVICRLDLGYTRIAGYTLYDDITEEFYETTPREVKELIRKEGINGLKLENNEIVLDEEGFNQKNLMIRSGVGKYRPLNSTDTLINRMYAVVDAVDYGGEIRYEVITNYCGRKLMTEEFIRTLNTLGNVAGIVVTSTKIELCNQKFNKPLTPKELLIIRNRDPIYKELNETAEADKLITIEEEVKEAEKQEKEAEKEEKEAENPNKPKEPKDIKFNSSKQPKEQDKKEPAKQKAK